MTIICYVTDAIYILTTRIVVVITYILYKLFWYKKAIWLENILGKPGVTNRWSSWCYDQNVYVEQIAGVHEALKKVVLPVNFLATGLPTVYHN